jgi:hypothetical protein
MCSPSDASDQLFMKAHSFHFKSNITLIYHNPITESLNLNLLVRGEKAAEDDVFLTVEYLFASKYACKFDIKL